MNYTQMYTSSKCLRLIYKGLKSHLDINMSFGFKNNNNTYYILAKLFLRSNIPPLKIPTNEIFPFARLIENHRPDKNGTLYRFAMVVIVIHEIFLFIFFICSFIFKKFQLSTMCNNLNNHCTQVPQIDF